MKMNTTTSRMCHALVAAVGLLVLAASLSACGGTTGNSKMSDLNSSVRGYHTALRLGRYYEASRYLDPADQQEFIGGYEELGSDFEIVEIEPKVISLGKDGEVAWSETQIVWYRLPDMTVQKDEIRVTWKYSNDSNAWYIYDRTIKINKKSKKRSALPGVYASHEKKKEADALKALKEDDSLSEKASEKVEKVSEKASDKAEKVSESVKVGEE